MILYQKKYNEWLEIARFDEQIKNELASISSDLKEIEDRFYKDLEFGTGGLRAIVGVGTNRLNKYTIRRITLGYADFLLNYHGEMAKEKGVVIAHDNRHFSDVFTMEIAQTLASKGIKTYVFRKITATPELSFSVPYLDAIGGIVVTASHNPPNYNGYKIYDETGCQVVPYLANRIIDYVNEVTDYLSVDVTKPEDNLISCLGESVDKAFIDAEKANLLHPELIRKLGDKFKILYTPLHGTGKNTIFRLLEETGFKQIYTVKEQLIEDPNFSTVISPNPEEISAFDMSLERGKEHSVDIILGTDPDCDRVGVLVRTQNDCYKELNGNQIGALLVNYLLSNDKKLREKKNPYIAKTIVTSELGAKIAAQYGVSTVNTLTGFKYIGEQINLRRAESTFIVGYEESYGYLVGTVARDKDGVGSSLVIAEMAAFYFEKNLTLIDVLATIYEKFGYYKEKLVSINLEGKKGIREIKKLMDKFRTLTSKFLEENEIEVVLDYLKGIDGLPKSNVIKIIFKDESWMAIRPSGTEPKIKFYIGVNGKCEKESDERLSVLEKIIQKVGK